jgi:hypothetical protein
MMIQRSKSFITVLRLGPADTAQMTDESAWNRSHWNHAIKLLPISLLITGQYPFHRQHSSFLEHDFQFSLAFQVIQFHGEVTSTRRTIQCCGGADTLIAQISGRRGSEVEVKDSLDALSSNSAF